MADFLTSLAARTLGVAPVVQPIIASMYAPQGTSMIGAHQAVLEEQVIMENASPLMDGQAIPESIPGRNPRGVQQQPVMASRSQFHQGYANEDIPRGTFSGNLSKPQGSEDAAVRGNAILPEKQTQSVPQRPSQGHLTAQSPQKPSHQMSISPDPLVQDFYATSMQEQQSEKNSLQDPQHTLSAELVQDFYATGMQEQQSEKNSLQDPQHTLSAEIELSIHEVTVPTVEPSTNHGAVDPHHRSAGVPLRMQPEAIAIQSSVESREIRSQKSISPENSVSSRSEQRTKAQKIEESAPTPLPPPTVQVTIGRIEVLATPAPDAPRTQTQRVPSPVMSLDQYLLQRSKGDH